MSGLFKLNHNNGANSDRININPFCTSPSRLQDVTENSEISGFHLQKFSNSRKFSCDSSPSHSKPLREYEEQITSLRKENFNLKLRLYFLEEKNQALFSNNDDETNSLHKENIELKVRVESLRKELEEKQELLCQAAKAMEVLDESQKEQEEAQLQKVEQLEQKIKFLESVIDTMDRGNQQYENFPQENMYFELPLNTIINDVDSAEKIKDLEQAIEEKDLEIESLNEKYEKLYEKNNEYEEKLEKFNEMETVFQDNETLKTKLFELRKDHADKTCIIDELEEKLKDKTTAYDNACLIIRQLTKQNHELENRTSPTKFEKSYEKEHIFVEKEKEILNLKIKINNLNKEIISLKDNLRKKTMFLQTIVNQELWEKNREIERLTKLLSKEKMFDNSKSSLSNIELEQSFTEDEYNAALEQKNELQRQVNYLIESLAKNQTQHVSSNMELEKLRQEIVEANERTVEALTWQKQCANVCHKLTKHLEELAGFLKSLLLDKSDIVTEEQRNVINQAIDNSLDFSKTLNNSLSFNENSLIDIYSINGVLEASLLDGIHHFNDSQRKRIESLQNEIESFLPNDYRKISNGELPETKPQTPSEYQNNSESETWSEPDRNVSQARIGLDTEKVKSNSRNSISTDSEYPTNNLEKRSRLSLCRLEDLLNEKDNKILQLQHQLVECDNAVKQEKIISMEKVQQLSMKIVDLENEMIRKNLTIENLNKELENKIKEVKEFETIKINNLVLESKLQTFKNDFEDIKARHNKDLEHLKNEQTDLEIEKQKLQENYDKLLMDKEYEIKQNIISRQECEKHLKELHFELSQKNELLKDYENVKKDYKTLEKYSRNLQKNLDEATIQSSKIALERTRVLNEKSEMENKIRLLEMELLKLSPRNPSGGGKSSCSSPEFLENFEIQIDRDGIPMSSDSATNLPTSQNLPHDCEKIELENIELKKKYIRTKRALIETCTKLKQTNLRKEQAERDIKQQILKTQNVLKDVRRNMDFELKTNGGILKTVEKENN